MTRPNDPPAFSWLRLIGKALLSLWIMGLGALYGIAAYQLFVQAFTRPSSGASGLMLVSFLAGVPLCIGLVVGYAAQRHRVAGRASASMLSMAAVALYVFAAGAVLREGMICILMATPLFLAMALIGALISGILNRYGGGHGPKLLSVALLLPLAIAPVEEDLPQHSRSQRIAESIHIEASPATIWQHLNQPLAIQHDELASGFAYRIGVPYPIEARTISGKVGGLRELRWERGVRFQEEITDWQPEHHIAWTYRFGPDSFPPGSLDDHILIGGRYFSLDTTAYSLAPEGNGTRLTIEVETRVTTNFNWYADLWARYLVTDTARTILRFYKRRAEASAFALRDTSVTASTDERR